MKNMKELYANIYHICKREISTRNRYIKKNKMIALLKILKIQINKYKNNRYTNIID